MKFFSMAEARANFAKILNSATQNDERIVITRNGEPTAIVLSIGDYEDMIDEIEIYTDPDLRTELAAAKADIEAGRYLTLNEVTELNQRRENGEAISDAEIDQMVNKGKPYRA